MKKVISLLVFCWLVGFAWGQNARFSVEVSIDSLLMENVTQVTFKLENASGKKFMAPDFEGFQVVGGPSQSSSFSMVNGEVNQSQSYTYYLQPEEVGNFYIQPASIETDQGVLETEPVLIIVVPNPDGIRQEASPKIREHDFFEEIPIPAPKSAQPKKKRRVYRI